MKALIKVGYGCNDHCAFCHTLHKRHVDGDADEVRRKIRRAKELGHSMVVLSGGEPTIRPELLSWADYTASLEMDFGLVTNGRMLAYAGLVEALMERRLRYVYLSLHGGTARVHDRMVRSTAFEETYAALGNLSGRGLDLHINCVVTKHNLEHLCDLVDACQLYTDASLRFSMVEPKGGGDLLFANLIPRVSIVAQRVAEAIRYAETNVHGLRVKHGGIPLCLVPGLTERYDDLRTHRFATMVEVGEPDFFPVDDLNKIQPDTCDECRLRGSCPGLYRGYYESFGAEEIHPVRGLRSNSCNYSLTRIVDAQPPSAQQAVEPCPLRDGRLGISPWDPARHLIVRNGPKVGIHRTETRDFSDVELMRIKHREQVYFDASKKDAPDDFLRDLHPLRRAPVCDGCEHVDECTGLYEPTFEAVFERDEDGIRQLLESASGDLLDLGCGESRYVDVLRRRHEAGAIRYLGIDPDASALSRFRARWTAAPLRCADAEALCDTLAGARFDHVVVLRSWNHLSDPDHVLAQIVAALKPNGWLTVVDDVPFALCRTKRHARRGESSRAKFEHVRNDDAKAAAARLEAFGFLLREIRPVSRSTSTLWFIRAQPC